MRLQRDIRLPLPVSEPDRALKLAIHQAWGQMADKLNGLASGSFGALDGGVIGPSPAAPVALGDFITNGAPTEQGPAGGRYIVAGWRAVEYNLLSNPVTDRPGTAAPWTLTAVGGASVTLQTELQRDPVGSWAPAGSNALAIMQGAAIAGGDTAITANVVSDAASVTAGQTYTASVYLACHPSPYNTGARIALTFYDGAGSVVGAPGMAATTPAINAGSALGSDVSTWTLATLTMAAPAGAVAAKMTITKRNTVGAASLSLLWAALPKIVQQGAYKFVQIRQLTGN